MVTLHETPTRIVVTAEAGELATLIAHFRFHPLNYYRADSYQLFKATNGEMGWDGYRYPLLRKTKTAGEILRGRKDEVLACCQKLGYRVDTSKLLVSPYVDLKLKDIPDDLIKAEFQLDDSQKSAILEWLRHATGIANHAVGAGKTALFAGVASFIKRDYPDARFLYFTPSERLVRQSKTEMDRFLPGWDITQYGGGGKRDNTGKDMVVCTQAILAKHYRKLLLEKWFETFMAVLVDESHHSASPTASMVLRSMPAFFRFGASDSLKESDPDRYNKIIGLCGPVRSTVTSGELISKGRSAKPHIYFVDVPGWAGKFRRLYTDAEKGSSAWFLDKNGWRKATYLGPVLQYDEDGKPKKKRLKKFVDGAWQIDNVNVTVPGLHRLQLDGTGQEIDAPASCTLLERRYDRAIINFKPRNELIVAWVSYYAVQRRWRTVVVATRAVHAVILSTMIQRAIGREQVRVLRGDASSVERDETFAWFKATPGAVMITSIIKEGVSINEIKAGVVADAVVDWEVAKQIVGRFIRKKPENQAHLTWFFDRQHPRYEQNSTILFQKLNELDGFTFYHPVQGPETIDQANVLYGRALPEEV